MGRRNDCHIKRLADELTTIGEKYAILENFSADNSFRVNFIQGITSGSITLGNSVVPIESIKSVWNWAPAGISIGKRMIEKAKKFISSEWTEGISSLWNSINTRWINHPRTIRAVSNKFYQLQIATNVGLHTPDTLITNEPRAFVDFFNKYSGNIIAKTLGGSKGAPINKMIFTTKMTKRDLTFVNDLRYAPCMFQAYVPKKTEFRVTVVGSILHVAEIHSQRSQKTKHDWRIYDDFAKTPYLEKVLPSDIESKILELMKVMGLEFGGIDLILTPDDRFVFLEVNTSGRWLWIEDLTGMNITRNIACFLADKF
jgi:glutathione synthase/RimK-type ligase-like ATP-grasp enzyme